MAKKKKRKNRRKAKRATRRGPSKRAVCVGINDYPGLYNDLNGCVNDADDWASLLDQQFQFGKKIRKLTNDEATRDNILSALDDLVTKTKEGDLAVFTYSGHGTWVKDQANGDESDNRDEALCAFDRNVIDDEIREIFIYLNSRKPCWI